MGSRALKKQSAKTSVKKAGTWVSSEEQIRRVRRLCAALPQTTEKLSHGEPTFFVGKKVFAMFANNHHNDGHIAVYVSVTPGLQAHTAQNRAGKILYAALRWG
jgi:hypothetical protein